ncbi:MAG: hypothetical protein HY934_08380 [Candidatus Firestonebacteria bacterium]|nr:hypothetical protein [Candidatus Firestonebacteria bacterium]
MKERLEKGSRKKHPAVAAMASVILPGAGQAYNREMVRALILIVLAISLIAWFIKMQIHYSKSYETMMKIEGVRDIAVEYARAQAPYRFIPLALYLGLIVFSAYDAYIFAAYILRTVMYKPKEDEEEKEEKKEKT